MDDVETALLDIVARGSSVERNAITYDSTIDELGIESLELVEILFEIEDHFDIDVPYNANSKDVAGMQFNTVGEVVELVREQVADKRSSGG